MSWLDTASDNDILLLTGGMIPMPVEDASNEEEKPEKGQRDWTAWDEAHKVGRRPRKSIESSTHRPGGRGKLPKRPWVDPPDPTGKGGRKAGGFTAVGITNTALGDAVENALIEHFGMANSHPGRRQGPLDVVIGKDGYEVKAVSTSATEYKAKPKKHEVESKVAFAKANGLNPHTMVVVYSPAAKQLFVYSKPGIGAYRLTNPSQGWTFHGTVPLDLGDNPDPAALRDAVDLLLRNWAEWDAEHRVLKGHHWLDTDAPKTNREWGEQKIAKAMADIAVARADPDKASEQSLPFSNFAWREKRGYKARSFEKLTERMFKAQAGNTRIRNNLVKEQAARAEAKGVENVRPEVRAGMEEGLRRLAADPRVEHLANALGIKVKINTQVNADAEPGQVRDDRWAKASAEQWRENADAPFLMHLNDYGNAEDKKFDLRDEDTNPGFDVAEPRGSGATVANGWHGTQTHEFGHVVEAALAERNDPRVAQWRSLWQRSHDDMEKSLADAKHPSDEWDKAFRNRVSYYSHENEKEGFAETFAAVMAPGYKQSEYPPAARPLLQYMEDLVSST